MALQGTTVTFDRPHVHLEATALGSGEALMLLPGLGRPPSDLCPLAQLLVDAGHAILLPDPRGIGASHGPLDGITLHDLAADAASLITSWVSSPVTVIGHAFGNRIARTLAVDRPELVKQLVLLSCSGKVQPEPDIAEAIRLAQATDTSPEVQRQAVERAWFGPEGDPTPWLDGWSQPVMKAYLAAAAATSTEDWWTAGQTNVLIVQGLADVAAPVANGRILKQDLGDRGILVELPGIGHALPVENPAACAGAILEFLRTQR
jgi:pimeloyl-ACP methyl ester carboxylesterase